MRKLAVLAIGVVIASSVGVVESADWPGWRGPERDGWSASKGLNLDWSSSKPKLLWKAEGDEISGYTRFRITGRACKLRYEVSHGKRARGFSLEG